MQKTIHIAKIDSTTSDSIKNIATELIIKALPEFYDMVPLKTEKLQKAVKVLLGLPGSEFEHSFIAMNNGQVIGVVAGILSDKLPFAYAVSSKAMLDYIEEDDKAHFLEMLKSYSEKVPPVPSQTLYLSRVGVKREWQRKGIGSLLIEKFGKVNDRLSISLHVHRANIRAIDFYKKEKFLMAENSGNEFFVYLKK
ncbi:MAG: GNAT family N-acetyltransferase [Desulfobacter sp.]|nr:MAG: GNAT family N-acetyltransferase [Desulfobacter sp.]